MSYIPGGVDGDVEGLNSVLRICPRYVRVRLVPSESVHRADRPT